MNSASTLLVPIKGGTPLAAWVYEEEMKTSLCPHRVYRLVALIHGV